MFIFWQPYSQTAGMDLVAHYIVGLTGGIGSGKTTVSDHFETLGIDVIDADVISRNITAKDKPAVAKIAEHFGDEALLAPGELDRSWLRKKVFADETAKRWLEQLLHPLIAQDIQNALATSATSYTIFSSPLLLETQHKVLAQRILVVDLPVEMQISRTLERDTSSSKATIEAIIKKQISRKERLALADDILDNTQGLPELYEQIEKLHVRYLQIAQKYTAK